MSTPDPTFKAKLGFAVREYPCPAYCNHSAFIEQVAYTFTSPSLDQAANCLNHWARQYIKKQDDLSCYHLLLAFEHARETFKRVTGEELPLQ